MPAVRKTQEHYWDGHESEPALIVRDALTSCDINHVYLSMVDYIKWYNKNIKS